MNILGTRTSNSRSASLAILTGVLVIAMGGMVTPSSADPGRHDPPPGGGQVRPPRPPIPQPLPKQDGAVSVRQADLGLTANDVALRSLVIALDSTDFGLSTWSSTLDRIGTPYDVLLAREQPLTADRLVRPDGTGRYQAVLLTNHSLLYPDGSGGYVSAFDAAEWNLLWQYERDYAVRQVSLYTSYSTFPEDYCLRAGREGAVGDTPIEATLPATGAALFERLRSDIRVPISRSYVYYSTVAPGCDARPILTTGGDVLGVLSTSVDGRQRVALTFTSNQYLPQAYLLTYGLFRWATKGVFLGEQRHYLAVDVDDWFISTDHLLPDGSYAPEEFRISGTDAYTASQMQSALRTAYPLASGFALNLAYNGEGADTGSPARCSSATPDPLTSYSRCLRDQFRWINHTFSHPKMNFTTYPENHFEIRENQRVAQSLKLSVPSTVLKTPEYSGLGVYHPDPDNDIDPPTDYGLGASNPALLAAAKDLGVRYLHGNMSFASHQPGCFNCGIHHPLEPALMVVPDWPTNIAYHVTTPAEETTFYNSYYGPDGRFPYWDHNLTYPEIVAWETDIGLQHVMTGSVYSHTFHQGNLREYAPGRNLTFDWLTAVAAKYTGYYTVPMLPRAWPDLAGYVADRSSHFATLTSTDVVWDRAAGTLTATSSQAGGVFLTGVAAGSTGYGAERITKVSLSAGNPVTLTPTPWTGP
jgi:hypothetical protein